MKGPIGIGAGARDTAITFFTRLLVMGVSIGIQSALAWLLGPEGRGSYAVCILFASLLGVVFTMSTDRAGQYFLASGRLGVSEGVWATVFSVLVGSGVAVFAGAALMRSGVEFFSKAPASSFRIALALIPVNVLFNSLVLLLMGLRRFRWMSRIAALRVIIHLVGTLILVWGLKLGVNGALIAAMAGGTASVALAFRYLRSGYELAPTWPRPAHCRSLLSYGIRYFVANLSNQVQVRIGTIMLAWFVATSQIGLFATAAAMASRVLLIPNAIEGALLSRVAVDPVGRPALVAQIARVSGMICGSVLLVLALASRPLVAVLFSPSFLPAAVLLMIIAPGVFLRSGSKVLMPYFMGINRPAVCSWAVGLGAVVNFVALLILLPVAGLAGAAWAMTLGYVTSSVILALAFRSAAGMGLAETWLPRREDAALLVNLFRHASLKLAAGRGRTDA